MGFIVHELSARVSSYRGDLGGTYWLFGALGRVSFWGVLVRGLWEFWSLGPHCPICSRSDSGNCAVCFRRARGVGGILQVGNCIEND